MFHVKRRKAVIMSNKKNFWYVLVMSDNGPVFVTSVNYGCKEAHWNKEEKPLEMTKQQAQELSIGLTLNFHNAFSVCNPFELNCQPYLYDKYDCQFIRKDNK